MDDGRLAWYLPDQLRWLDENRDAGYMPCGQLVGITLRQCADIMEDLQRQLIEAEGRKRDAPQHHHRER